MSLHGRTQKLVTGFGNLFSNQSANETAHDTLVQFYPHSGRTCTTEALLDILLQSIFLLAELYLNSIHSGIRQCRDMNDNDKGRQKCVNSTHAFKAKCDDLPMHSTKAGLRLVGSWWLGWESLHFMPASNLNSSQYLNTFYNVHTTKQAPQLHPSIRICWLGSRACCNWTDHSTNNLWWNFNGTQASKLQKILSLCWTKLWSSKLPLIRLLKFRFQLAVQGTANNSL